MGYISSGSEFNLPIGGMESDQEFWIMVCPNYASDEYIGAVFPDHIPAMEAVKYFTNFLYHQGVEIYYLRKTKVMHSSLAKSAHLN